MQFNWIDWVIIVVTLYYVYEGFEDGLTKLGTDLISFLGALWLTVRYHGVVGRFIEQKFGTSSLWTNVVGYLVVGFVAEVLISLVLDRIVKLLPGKWEGSRIDRGLGAVFSALKALIIITFVLLLTLALPLRGTVKSDIRNSVIGGKLISLPGKYVDDLNETLDEQVTAAMKFVTIKPQSNETLELTSLPKNCEYRVDIQAEKEMLGLVNKERTADGKKILVWNEDVAQVARKHSLDMFERRYFAHQNPEGYDVGDRLQNGGVDYSFAGENLAFAPDVKTAHEGLMDSSGHKANILEENFGKIGIGIYDGGVCGMMFTQNFVD
ncbi:MAG: CvpA family protein [Patescibacteria group bacterium]